MYLEHAAIRNHRETVESKPACMRFGHRLRFLQFDYTSHVLLSLIFCASAFRKSRNTPILTHYRVFFIFQTRIQPFLSWITRSLLVSPTDMFDGTIKVFYFFVREELSWKISSFDRLTVDGVIDDAEIN